MLTGIEQEHLKIQHKQERDGRVRDRKQTSLLIFLCRVNYKQY